MRSLLYLEQCSVREFGKLDPYLRYMGWLYMPAARGRSGGPCPSSGKNRPPLGGAGGGRDTGAGGCRGGLLPHNPLPWATGVGGAGGSAKPRAAFMVRRALSPPEHRTSDGVGNPTV